jgi:MFS family permease
MAAANSWPNLLVPRFFLGFAVGAKSSTTPVYAAESAPKNHARVRCVGRFPEFDHPWGGLTLTLDAGFHEHPTFRGMYPGLLLP